ncbi:2 iron, 2 sulfur cluster binding [Sparganum proliferum]
MYLPLLFRNVASAQAAVSQVFGRAFHRAAVLCHGDYERQPPKSPDDIVRVTFITKDKERIQINGKVGDNLLYLARFHKIDMEGACEASLACSTCHVYVNEKFFNRLPPALDGEEDMLDLAVFLKPNSRLGCQIILSKELDGLEVELPPATRNFYVDGHKPEAH